MTLPVLMRRVVEHRQLRTADDIGRQCLRRPAHPFEPVGVGDFVVVDDEEMPEFRELDQSCQPAGIVGAAIAALMRDDQQAGNAPGLEPGACRRHALAAFRVVLHHDDGKTALRALPLQRSERLQHLLRAAKGRHRHDHIDSLRIEAGTAGDERDRRVGGAGIHVGAMRPLKTISVSQSVIKEP